MKNGGRSFLLPKLQTLYNTNEPIEIEIDWYDDGEIIILDGEFDSDDIYKFNEELEMYVNVDRKIFCNATNQAYEIMFFSYLKILNN